MIAPGRRVVTEASHRIGRVNHVSCGAGRSSGLSQPSIVGTSTSEIPKSIITPTAEPSPNSRTATTLLIASDAIPSAVVPLAPRSGAARCATVDLNAVSASLCRRSSL